MTRTTQKGIFSLEQVISNKAIMESCLAFNPEQMDNAIRDYMNYVSGEQNPVVGLWFELAEQASSDFSLVERAIAATPSFEFAARDFFDSYTSLVYADKGHFPHGEEEWSRLTGLCKLEMSARLLRGLVATHTRDLAEYLNNSISITSGVIEGNATHKKALIIKELILLTISNKLAHEGFMEEPWQRYDPARQGMSHIIQIARMPDFYPVKRQENAKSILETLGHHVGCEWLSHESDIAVENAISEYAANFSHETGRGYLGDQINRLLMVFGPSSNAFSVMIRQDRVMEMLKQEANAGRRYAMNLIRMACGCGPDETNFNKTGWIKYNKGQFDTCIREGFYVAPPTIAQFSEEQLRGFKASCEMVAAQKAARGIEDHQPYIAFLPNSAVVFDGNTFMPAFVPDEGTGQVQGSNGHGGNGHGDDRRERGRFLLYDGDIRKVFDSVRFYRREDFTREPVESEFRYTCIARPLTPEAQRLFDKRMHNRLRDGDNAFPEYSYPPFAREVKIRLMPCDR